ncbi:methyltransferase [Tenacibaculum jejuense]|uniref:rRNA (Guanine-N(2)-)-methyltransferase n=1 Tax=Tenacibaculum jejuense TaxID=584609 RepID=A0A238U9A2_9FLAO|nr:methyltransferase [Tenacibaculum jejuense]SNR15054.1 rRNA (Guanine-N(2)-)-methyltransferase [Tenacibaculum jejuense]
METTLEFNNTIYHLERYPDTKDNSLKAWSNAELLALNYLEDAKFSHYHLFNDRFGVWNCLLKNKPVKTIWTYASQKKAIQKNLQFNRIVVDDSSFIHPLDEYGTIDCALVKIPKSLELFELFLAKIHKASKENTEVVCCFMTKYFSASYLKIAENYFSDIQQTKAWKKARLLILKKPKKELINEKKFINQVSWKGEVLDQYYGVFSSKSIDIGTQFLLENLEVTKDEIKVLDVASGNGIIARELLKLNENCEPTLIDDFNLAIASSKFNLPEEKSTFICDNNLLTLKKNNFDLAVSNPPFHFEYENNIEVSLNLFSQVKDCLKDRGRFVLVANKHLNYKVHLKKLFTEVTVVNSNKKFEIISCSK